MKLVNIKYLFIGWIFLSNVALTGPNEYLSSIHNQPDKLYTFFKTMPKGGELHYHFTGSAYPEELISITTNSNLYLNPKNYAISKNHSKNTVQTKSFFENSANIESTVRAWSMKNLIAPYAVKHDHFFNIFPKVTPIYQSYYRELLAKMLARAANQNEMYMEIMLQPLEGAEKFVKLIKHHESFAKKKDILINNVDFNKRTNMLSKVGARYLNATHNYLQCDKLKPTPKACNVVVRWQTYALRENDENIFFTQALAAFIAASKSPDIVGVNIVQPENGKLALMNFKKQMQIFNFLHNEFRDVHIAIHAGELDPKTNVPQNLFNHINDSIFIAHAERIGHGTDIRYEKNQKNILNYMAKHNVPVEINLTSNELILSIYGKDSPLNYYLKNNVPVVLSTDDEGILQTDLTTQYINAAINHNLNYNTLKIINRNSLTYSFLPGKSIWSNPKKAILVKECEDLQSKACQSFIEGSQKAKLQWELEKRLVKFENKYIIY